MKEAFIAMLVLVTALFSWSAWENRHPVSTVYKRPLKNVTAKAEGIRLVHLSDIHMMGRERFYRELADMTDAAKPDLILISGDWIDRRICRVDQAVAWAGRLARTAPVYFAPGNHDLGSGQYRQLAEGLRAKGVVVLEDASATVVVKGCPVRVCGLRDISWYGRTDLWKVRLDTMTRNRTAEELVILLAHQGRYFPEYRRFPVDLVLSGHSHGGLIRIGSQGLIEPKQGLVPKYTWGLYGDGPVMEQSRGIGNTSIMPLRINNRPEMVILDL